MSPDHVEPMLPLDGPGPDPLVPRHGIYTDENAEAFGVQVVRTPPVVYVEGGVSLPVLPYPSRTVAGGHNSGWSGSDTSRERAEAADSDGTTTARQQAILRYLALTRFTGATWRETADHFEWHHGQASGALSNLHKAGMVVRLAEERRDRCAVYVLPQYAGERTQAPYGRRQQEERARLTLDHAGDVLTSHAPVSERDEHGALPPTCTCGWTPDRAHDYTHHLLEELAKGAK